MRKKGTALILGMAMMVASSSVVQASGVDKLTDIKGHWAYNDIAKAYEDKVVAGYSDNTFKPNNKVTTHEFLKMITVAATGLEEVTYRDRPWYEPYVNRFKENYGIQLYGGGGTEATEAIKAIGIDNDLANNIITESKEISREEAAVVLSKALLYKAMGEDYINISLEKGNINFNDLSGTSAKNAEIAIKTGLMVGDGEGTSWRPNDGLTRAEAVTIVNKVKEVDTIEVFAQHHAKKQEIAKEEKKQEIKKTQEELREEGRREAIESNEAYDRMIEEKNNTLVIDIYEVINIVNEERDKEGLAHLKVNETLNEIAYKRAKEMADLDYYSHESPTGNGYMTLIEQYVGNKYKAIGENITMQRYTAEEAMDGWMNSSGHRRNILSKSYTEIGVGYHKGRVVQVFMGR